MTDWTSRSIPEDSYSFVVVDGKFVTNEAGLYLVVNTATHQTEWRPREVLA